MEVIFLEDTIDPILELDSPNIGFDIETAGLDPWKHRILLMVFCAIDSETVYVIDANKAPVKNLKGFMESRTLYGANLQFDCKFVRIKFGINPRNLVDVIIRERVSSMGLRLRGNSLDDILERYNIAKLDKSIRSTFFGHSGRKYTQEQIEYAAADVYYLGQATRAQEPFITQKNLWPTVKLEEKLTPILVDMEVKGILLDKDKWLTLAENNIVIRDEYRRKLCDSLAPRGARQSLFPDETGSLYELDLNSSPQMVKAFNAVGIKVTSVNKKALSHVKSPIAKLYTEYKEIEKVVSSYGKNWLNYINPKTHRIHSNFKQLEARTGRLACGDPALQTIPSKKEFRECFIAPPGFKIITADYSQIELIILADLTEEQALITAFETNRDVHSETASIMFGIPFEQCGKDSVYRSLGKMLNFAIIYGQGDAALAELLQVPVNKAADLKEQYFKKLPKVTKWKKRAAKDPVFKGYAETKLGRKRFWWLENMNAECSIEQKQSMETAGPNHCIQGLSADITKLAMVWIGDYLYQNPDKGYLIDSVHDEILVEVPDKHVDEMLKFVKEKMIAAATRFIKKVPVNVSIGASQHWEK